MTLLAVFCFLGARAQETVEIGDGTSASYYTPIGTLYSYSITEQLYTADEIGMAGTISSISFYYVGTAAKDFPITVYMANVDAEDLSTGISLAEAEQVFDGTLSVTEAGWATIDLDTPFSYDGTSNLLIGINKGYVQWFSGNTWRYTEVNKMARYTQNDNNAYDTSTVPGIGTSYRPNIQIVINPSGGPTCAKPTTLEASSITVNGATFVWENTGAESYSFEYKKATESEWTVFVEQGKSITANTATLTNLAPGTTYNVRVKAICGEGDESSYKSNTFTTLYGIPLNEAFATTSAPTGWTRYSTLLTDDVLNGTTALTTSTSGWYFGSSNDVFDNHARLNIYGTTCQSWLVTPTLPMENNVQLTFDLALTKYSGSLQPIINTLGEDDRFVVLITTDGGATWQILREWNNTGSEYVYNDIACSAVGQAVAIDLSSYAGQSIAVAFYGESTVKEDGSDNNLHIDNVSIDYIPTCAKPTGVAASDVVAHEATITWVSDATAWQVQLNEEDPIDVTEATYTFTELDPETNYSVKVRTNCGGTYSGWTNAVSFTTGIACAAPTTVETSNIYGHGVTITWDEIEGAMYQCAMVETDNYDENNINWCQPFEGYTQSWSNLNPETGYTFVLRKDCSAAEDGYSQIVTKTFTTTVACAAPTGLTVTLTPGNGTVATLSWTEIDGGATAWVLEYGTANDFTGATSVNVSGTPSLDITGLTAETTYYARVKALCGGEDGESQWSTSFSFTPTNAYFITVNDGTTTNEYVPIYGYWCDNTTKSQFIIPAADLADMQWGTISKITFYASNASVSWGAAEFEVYITETSETTLSAFADYSTMDKVKNAGILAISGNKMEVTFDAPYQYLGGNLMIGFLQTTSGSYADAYWYGVEAGSGAAWGGYGSSVGAQSFLPKVTFAYEPGEEPSCLKPTRVTASNVTAHEATITWTSNASDWEIQLNDETPIAVTEATYTFDSLDPETTYSVKVRTNCGDDGYSEWTNAVSFTTGIACPVPTDVTVSNVTGYTAEVSWTSDASNFVVAYKSGVVREVEEWTEVNVTTNSYSLSDLVPETEYLVRVKAVCGGIDGESLWATISFTTTVACPTPTVTVSNITAYTAEVSCTNTGAEYFSLMLGEEVIAENVTMPYILTELEPNTSYTVKVKAICGGEDGESEWSDGTSFMTGDICPDGMVCIGSGTSTSNDLPVNNFYNYSLTEQIYTADEIGEAGAIFSIEFYKAATIAAVKDLDIYMVATDKDEFASGSDFITVTAADLVYSGTVTFTDNDWTTIELDTPFNYDGVSNLAIIVDNNTGSYESNTAFRAFTDVKSRTLYYRTDYTNPDPLNPTVSATKTNFKNRIRIAIGELPACLKPTGFAVDNIGPHTAELSWNSNATAWQICVNNDETNLIDVTENPYILTGLDPETEYTVKVRTNCGDDGYSEWTKPVSFTTNVPCPAPTALAVSDVTATTANVSWNAFSNADLRYLPYDDNMMFFQGFVTDPSAMSDGSDACWLKGSQSTFGPSMNYASGHVIADDFTIDAATTLTQIEVYGYQTGSTTESTFTGLYVQIYDGNPADGGTAIWGDMEANIMTSTSFTNCYRGSNNQSNGMTRPIMAITANVSVDLEPGTYWLVYGTTGTLPSGPWCVPYCDPTLGNTGEGIQYSADDSAWQTLADSNSGETYGCAMKLNFGDIESFNWTYVNNISADEYALTNLEPDTHYMLQVRANFDGEGNSEWVTAMFTTLPSIELVNDDSGNAAGSKNSDVINTYNGQTVDVTLTDRILYKDEKWNTICLPFDVTIAGSPLDGEGVTAKTLVGATVTPSGDHISLNFGDTNLTALEAGVPYIIKWDKDVVNPEIQNPVFTGVTIKNSTEEERTVSPINEVKFIGYYDAKPITAADENIYYMTANNTLKHTGQDRTLKSLRAYFEFTVPSGSVREFTLNFGDGESSGIISIDSEQLESNWYTIDGKMLDKQPTRKGVYIKDGVKVVIK